MRDDKSKPLSKLMCKVQCKICGREFVTELATPWEGKGKLECPHCNLTAHYSPKDLLRI